MMWKFILTIPHFEDKHFVIGSYVSMDTVSHNMALLEKLTACGLMAVNNI